jgi:hypothetical protein
MPKNITLNSNTYLRLLLIVPAVGLLGLTGCSTADRTVGQNRTGGNVQILARTYDSESRDFDRPWPFGPESTQENIRKADDYWLPPGRAEGQPYNQYGPRSFATAR